MIKQMGLKKDVAALFDRYKQALEAKAPRGSRAQYVQNELQALFDDILSPLGIRQSLPSGSVTYSGTMFVHEIEHILVDREFIISVGGMFGKSGRKDKWNEIIDEQVANLLDPDERLDGFADLFAEDLISFSQLGQVDDEDAQEIIESQLCDNPKWDRIWVQAWKNSSDVTDLQDRMYEAAHNFYQIFSNNRDAISADLVQDFIAVLRRAKNLLTIKLRRES
jgi:hypothetical protein